MKIISKVLSTRLKNVLLFQISSTQTTYVKNRFILESGRMISDKVFQLQQIQKKNLILLITASYCKFFENSDFVQILLAGLKRFKKIKTLASSAGEKQQTISNQKGARQGDPISAYLCIIVLEIFSIFVRNICLEIFVSISLNMNLYILFTQMTLLSFSKTDNL